VWFAERGHTAVEPLLPTNTGQARPLAIVGGLQIPSARAHRRIDLLRIKQGVPPRRRYEKLK
jgi:hypothetical protein